jgi:hypothetical protein
LTPAGVQEIVIWTIPANGQHMNDLMQSLARDALPHAPQASGARVREQFATMPVKRSHPGAKRDAEHKPRVALRAAGVASQSPMA